MKSRLFDSTLTAISVLYYGQNIEERNRYSTLRKVVLFTQF